MRSGKGSSLARIEICGIPAARSYTATHSEFVGGHALGAQVSGIDSITISVHAEPVETMGDRFFSKINVPSLTPKLKVNPAGALLAGHGLIISEGSCSF